MTRYSSQMSGNYNRAQCQLNQIYGAMPMHFKLSVYTTINLVSAQLYKLLCKYTEREKKTTKE